MYNANLATANRKPPGCSAIVYDDILQVIGNTPLVKLNRIPKDHGLECEMYAKCEYMNPGDSIKDRIAHAMVVDAEKNKLVHEGTRFVEPTSGNTGIGLALTAAVKGYHTTIVTPDKNSEEKMNTLRLLGADIVQTPSTAKMGDPDYYMTVAKRIVEEDPVNNICLNQFSNPVNPKTHMKTTACEILNALWPVDLAVMGVGSGGTITGVAHCFKKLNPHCTTIVAVDPKGSLLWEKELAPYYVEGIGDDFVPEVLDKYCVDRVVHTTDEESFNMAREVIRKEGLLCGGSSGAALSAAVRVAKDMQLGAGKTVVVVLPDSIRNYMTGFVCDQWMEAHLFKPPPQHKTIQWWNDPLGNLDVDTTVPHIKHSATCRDAIESMGSQHNLAIVVGDDGFYQGVISKNKLRNAATNPKKEENLNLEDPVSKHLIHDCLKVVENVGTPTVGLVSRIMDITAFVVKVTKINNPNSIIEIFKPKGIITSEMVWQYILEHQARQHET